MVFALTSGTKSPITAATGTRAFRYTDGTLCVEVSASTSAWSSDGVTWSTSPIGGRAAPGPGLGANETAALYVAATEIVSMARQLTGSASPWSLAQRRSTNDWVTVSSETSSVAQPFSIAYNPPGESRVPSMLFDRGVIKLASGDLIALLYGLITGDATPCAGWPTAYGSMKARIMRVSSSDKGVTWIGANGVMSGLALGRGTGASPDPLDIMPVPMVSLEGTTTNCMAIAASGSVLCFARSGARLATQQAPVQATPIYYTVSSGTFGSTSTPLALSLGVDTTLCGDAPSAVVLDNGIVVVGYTLPGTGVYLVFSLDNGATWGNLNLIGGPTTFRITLIKTTGNNFLAFYQDSTLPGTPFVCRPYTATL